MNKRNETLKNLAKSIVSNGGVDKKSLDYIESNLTRSEVRTLLYSLKTELERQTVVITSAGDLPNEIHHQFEKDFSDKKIVYNEDEKLGAGLKLKVGDDVYDFSFRNYINQTIEKLKE